MSLELILDGYNIIKQTPRFADLNIDAGREQLIRAIEKNRPQGSLRNRVTIIFDGKPGRVTPSSSPAIEVIFSYEESADDRIKALVAKSDHARNIIVVTNDREIQRHVKAHGAAVWSVAEFMNKLTASPAAKAILLGQAAGKEISKSLEHTINAELEKVWLDKHKK